MKRGMMPNSPSSPMPTAAPHRAAAAVAPGEIAAAHLFGLAADFVAERCGDAVVVFLEVDQGGGEAHLGQRLFFQRGLQHRLDLGLR